MLERVAGNHDTYYVYDGMGRLRFVLPPCASDALASNGSWSLESNTALQQYAYYYEYNSRGLCSKKKLPGAAYVLYEYDAADRLAFSQDGNQRASGKWTYYLYDGLGRLTEQGECTDKSTLAGKSVLVKNYYDSYGFVGGTGFPASQFPADATGYGTGMLTGSEVTVPDSNTKLYNAYYYDVKGRTTKMVQGNLLGGYEVTATTYTFTDQPATVSHTHTASGKTTRTEVYTYTYDSLDRLSKVEHTLGGTKVTLVIYTYDDLGRLSTKLPHGSAANKLTYSYNIRGWLTGISGAKFTQNLYYNSGVGTPLYNGNISSMTWQAGGEATVRGYRFTYDPLDRMLSAVYGESASITANINRFSENVTGYDKNGNILRLTRFGQTGASAYGLIDNLTYTLAGNQLNRVDDAATTSAYGSGFEFQDMVKQANEYAYDANGNLTKDLNKNIASISYNCLNLPSVVTFGDGSTITYTYAADGTKLRTVHKIGSTATQTDYCGNVVYEAGVQKYLLTEEGYVSLSDSQYHYYLKDYQGNNRVVINSSGTVEEVNHYYPFGGIFAKTNNVQPYKYNGKEHDNQRLNWYDYGARHYDAALGRFHTNDRFAEKYHSLSPYQYGANNPVGNIDVNGDSVRVYTETNNFGHSWLSVGEGDSQVIYSYGRYNGTYKGAKGIHFLNSASDGDGVLLRLTGNEVDEYMAVKEKEGMATFVITDVEDAEVGKMLDEIFYSSIRLPDNPNSDYWNKSSARIIDKYELTKNNCTTFVSDILNNAGSKVLNSIHYQQTSNFGTFSSYPIKERFVVPSSLQKFLNQSSLYGGNVYKVKK